MPKTDTFTYTFSQLFVDELFIIMAKLADAADLKRLCQTQVDGVHTPKHLSLAMW